MHPNGRQRTALSEMLAELMSALSHTLHFDVRVLESSGLIEQPREGRAGDRLSWF